MVVINLLTASPAVPPSVVVGVQATGGVLSVICLWGSMDRDR